MDSKAQPILSNSLFKFIVSFLNPYRWEVGGLISCAILAGTYSTIHSYLLKSLIDIVNDVNSENVFKATLFPVILFVVNIEFLNNIAWRGINYINLKMAPELKNRIIEELFCYVHKHSYRFFQNNFTGTITSNIHKIADNCEKIIHQLSLFIIRGFTQFILALFTMSFISPLFSISLLIWIIVFTFLSVIHSKKVIALTDKCAKTEALVAGLISDSVSGATSVKLFAREDYERKYLKGYLDSMAMRFRNKEWFLLNLSLMQGLSITLLVGIMVFILINLKAQSLVTVGDFAFVLGLTMYIAENIWWVMAQIVALNSCRGQCKQSLEALIIPHEITNNKDAQLLVVKEGTIDFKDVYFNHSERKEFFKNKSIKILSGQRVGLVGASGSGKTTFANLIVRMFDPSSGYITIDNQNIARVTQKSLRESISFVPQEPILFHRNLMDNIRYGKADATNEEVIDASKKAYAHDFIMETSKGYDSVIGERGIKLSGGERQRIGIARAILKNAPILILDEATSALDSVTEAMIQNSLKSLMQEKTVLVIAHRLSTLLLMDRILVFEKGKIVEDGTHADLLAKGGIYSKLWNTQIGEILLDVHLEV